jgi:flagellar biosynthesis protein FlhG
MGTEERKARRIAVISGKGGVGKTIITANLAASLASGRQRVLVVDADLGLANLDILLGVLPEFTLLDALHGACPPDAIVLQTDKGFDLLPAGSGLPEGTVATQVLTEGIQSILQSMESRYDIILFDAGAGVGDVVLFFAGLADKILLVVTPEPTSIMDCYATIKILSQLHARRHFLLIVNQVNPNSSKRVGATVLQNLQSVISQFINTEGREPVQLELMGSIPIDPAIPKALRNRQLISESSPEAPSLHLMHQIADSIRTHLTWQ